jgi:hypothetical protein
VDFKGGGVKKKKLAIWRVLNYETMLTGGGGLALYFYFIFKCTFLFSLPIDFMFIF